MMNKLMSVVRSEPKLSQAFDELAAGISDAVSEGIETMGQPADPSPPEPAKEAPPAEPVNPPTKDFAAMTGAERMTYRIEVTRNEIAKTEELIIEAKRVHAAQQAERNEALDRHRQATRLVEEQMIAEMRAAEEALQESLSYYQMVITADQLALEVFEPVPESGEAEGEAPRLKLARAKKS